MHPRDAWINRFKVGERYSIDLRSSFQLISSLDLTFLVFSEMRCSNDTFTIDASLITFCDKFCVDVLLQLIDLSC